MKKVVRLIFLLLVCCLAFTPANSSPGDSKTLLFLRNHISLESGFTFLRVKPLTETGIGNMSISCRPGMYLGGKYHINLNDYFAVRFGAIAGVHSFRYDFEPGATDSLSFSPVKMAVVKPYLSVPMEMNVRYRFRQRHVVGLVAGISLNLISREKIWANASLSDDPTGEERYRLELRYQQPNPFVNFETGVEYHWVLGNMDMVRFGLKYSIGLRPMFHAQYEHRENDLVLSSGSFASYGDNLSIGVSYVFTRVNRLLDK